MLKLIRTSDNSFTLYNEVLDETYHSKHGALQESMHVFIQHGLHYLSKKDTIRILEIGFGTGLNAILSLKESNKTGTGIHYTAIEPFLPEQEIVSALNYGELLGLDASESDYYSKMTRGESFASEEPNFSFVLKQLTFQEFNTSETFDLMYYDAFAPDKQADMWTQEIFDNCYRLLNPGGVLVTYCAKGAVRRMLKQAGFSIDILPGPPGKREMTRAIKAGQN